MTEEQQRIFAVLEILTMAAKLYVFTDADRIDMQRRGDEVKAAISEALARAEAAEKSAAERLVTIQVMEAAHIVTRSKLSEAEAVIAPFAAEAMMWAHHGDDSKIYTVTGAGMTIEDVEMCIVADLRRAAAFKAEG